MASKLRSNCSAEEAASIDYTQLKTNLQSLEENFKQHSKVEHERIWSKLVELEG